MSTEHKQSWDQLIVDCEKLEFDSVRNVDKPKIKLDTLIDIQKYKAKLLKENEIKFK